MSPSETTSPGGLLEPVWRILDGALATVQNRLELFQVEAREEKIRFIETFLLASIVVVLGTLAAAVGTFTAVVLLWMDGSYWALAGIAAAYAAGAGFALRALQKRLKAGPPFAALSEELRKDRACIRP